MNAPHGCRARYRVLGIALRFHIVFQIALFSAIIFAALVSTWAWSARVTRDLTAPHDARRVLIALERACSATVRRCLRRLAAPATGALLVLAISHLLLRRDGHGAPIAVVLVGAALIMSAGMLLAFGITTYCGYHVRRYSFAAVLAASASTDRCLSVAAASTARLAVTTEALGLLLTALVNGLLWFFARGAFESPTSAHDAGLVVACVAPYFGIGAAVGAIALQQTGSACVGALKLAGGATFESRTGLAPNDPRNPSVLVEAVALQLGSVVPRILDSLVSGVLLASIAFQLAWVTTKLDWAHDAWAIAMVPLLIRAFGMVAALFGLITLRTTEHEDVRRALWRGQFVAYTVLASAVVGLSIWIAGSLSILLIAVCATALVLTPALGHLRTLLTSKSQSPAPNGEDGATAASIAEVIATDLKVAAAAPFGYALIILLVIAWLQHTAVGELQLIVAVLLALSLPSALTTWNVAVTTCFDVASIGTLSAAIGRIPLPEDTAYRLKRMRDGTARVGVGLAASLPESSAALCALSALVCFGTHLRSSALSPPLLGLLGMMVWVGLPGLLATAAAFRAGARTARTQANEIDRQLRGMRRDGSQIIVPDDFVPSYRSCVELLARDSVQGNLLFVVAAVALPVILARLTASPENIAGSTAASLAFYASLAAAVGLFVSAIGYGASVVPNSVGRASVSTRPPGSGSTCSSTETQRLVDFFRLSLGVSAPLLTKAVALATLAFSAMLL